MPHGTRAEGRAAMSVAAESIVSFLCRLRAVKEYTAEPVDQQALDSILEVGRWTGTGGNRQGTEVIVIRDAAVKKQFGEWGAAPAATAAVIDILRAAMVVIGHRGPARAQFPR
jgi:nitroreductase